MILSEPKPSSQQIRARASPMPLDFHRPDHIEIQWQETGISRVRTQKKSRAST